jgi:gas vesicle structural protein
MVLERSPSKSNLIDVFDRVIDKGIVIDAWLGLSLVGIELVTVEARVIVASIQTYMKHSDAVAQVTPGLLARTSVESLRAKPVAPPPPRATRKTPRH